MAHRIGAKTYEITEERALIIIKTYLYLHSTRKVEEELNLYLTFTKD